MVLYQYVSIPRNRMVLKLFGAFGGREGGAEREVGPSPKMVCFDPRKPIDFQQTEP